MHCALRRLVVRKTETEEMSVHPHSLASEHVQPTHQGLPVGVHSRIQRQWNLKRLQERNQILSVCYGYVQTERMALNGTRTNMKALRHKIGFQPLGVEAFGPLSGSARTPAQTDLAYFWAANYLVVWHQALRDISSAHALHIGKSARLFALADLAMADAGITAWDTKRHYVFWRPITAIQE